MMSKPTTFEEWLLDNENELCDMECNEIAERAWNAAKESEMLANHPDVARARREN
jgi:hypothetical protein